MFFRFRPIQIIILIIILIVLFFFFRSCSYFDSYEYNDTVIKEDYPMNIQEDVSIRKKQFVTATWNVDRLTMRTKNSRVDPLPSQVFLGKKSDVIFNILEYYNIDIVALQEIYLNGRSSPDLNFPLEDKADYKVLTGKVIKRFGPPLGNEYCPIVYKDSVFDCQSIGQWSLERGGVHWAKCTFDNDSASLRREFYFGCSNFPSVSSGSAALDATVSAFFQKLNDINFPPNVSELSGQNKDNFIIGLNANSGYHGANSKSWKKAYKKWKNQNIVNGNLPQDIIFEKTKPVGGYSKISLNGGVYGASLTQEGYIPDDIFWSLDNSENIIYKANSKKIVPIFLPSDFVTISDHKPLIATFNY